MKKISQFAIDEKRLNYFLLGVNSRIWIPLKSWKRSKSKIAQEPQVWYAVKKFIC